MTGVGARGAAAVKWGAIASIARFVVQLGVQVALARTLGPDIYGVFALGLVAYTFTNFFADFGFGWSLVQKVELRDEDIRLAFTWQLATGTLAAVVLAGLAPLLAAWLREPRVGPVVQWMALACVLNSASAPAANLLRRDLNFRALGLVQFGSYVVGFALVGLPLALAGQGVWALVAAFVAQAGASLVATFALRPHAVRLLPWHTEARAMFGTSLIVFGTNLTNWFLTNMDRLLLGRLANTQAVGLYSVGYNLANLPNIVLMGVLQPAFLAAGARMQDEPERLRAAYVEIMATVLALLLPLFAGVALVAPLLVQLVYGSAWQEAGPVFAVLSLAMPVYLAWGMSTPVLWNTGRKHLEALLQLPVLAMAIAAYLAWSAQGAWATACVAVAVLALRALVMVVAACRAVHATWGDFFPDLLRGLGLAVWAVSAMALVQWSLAGHQGPIVSLLAMLAAGAAAGVLPLLLVPKLLSPAALKTAGRFAPAVLPALVARLGWLPALRHLKGRP